MFGKHTLETHLLLLALPFALACFSACAPGGGRGDDDSCEPATSDACADAGTQPPRNDAGHVGTMTQPDGGGITRADAGQPEPVDAGVVAMESEDGGTPSLRDAGASIGVDAGSRRTDAGVVGCGACATGCCDGTRCILPSMQSNAQCGGGGDRCTICGSGVCSAGDGCVDSSGACSVTAPTTAAGRYHDTCTGNSVCRCPRGEETCAGTGSCVDLFGGTLVGIYVRGAQVPARDPDGDCWDGTVTCQFPDPYVHAQNGTVELGETYTVLDTLTPRWDPPGLFVTTFGPRDSLSLDVFDEDVTFDSPMFSCPSLLITGESARARRIPCNVGGASVDAILVPR